MKSLVIAIVFPLFGLSQTDIPIGTNQIAVKGVTFKEVGNALLDAGYSFAKIDSNFQTIKTEFKTSTVTYEDIMFDIRIKDTTAFISAGFYNSTLGNLYIEYGKPKGMKKRFSILNDFALSFKKPVSYSTIK